MLIIDLRTVQRPLSSSSLISSVVSVTPYIRETFEEVYCTHLLLTNTLSVTLTLVIDTVTNRAANDSTHNCFICVSPNVVPKILFMSNVPLVNLSEGQQRNY